MTVLVLIGAGGHGKVVADIAELSGWGEIVFVDDDWPNRTRNGIWPIVGDLASIPERKAQGADVFVSIGANAGRETVTATLDGGDLPVLRHPSSTVSRHSGLGAGTLVCAGVVVNPATGVGRGVILNTGCSVDHDCTIGDFAHVSPGARLAGGVTVGAGTWVGIGASVREGVKIGAGARIGAGAAVVSDIPDGALAMGVPARIVSGRVST